MHFKALSFVLPFRIGNKDGALYATINDKANALSSLRQTHHGNAMEMPSQCHSRMARHLPAAGGIWCHKCLRIVAGGASACFCCWCWYWENLREMRKRGPKRDVRQAESRLQLVLDICLTIGGHILPHRSPLGDADFSAALILNSSLT